MLTFIIWCKKQQTKKEGKEREYCTYGIVRENQPKEEKMPLVKFSKNCLNELIKNDIELPQVSGHYAVAIDETRLVKNSKGQDVEPYWYMEETKEIKKGEKTIKDVFPVIWFLGSIVSIVKLESNLPDGKEKAKAYAHTEEDDTNF